MCKETVVNLGKVLNAVVTIEDSYRIPVTVNGENKIIAQLTRPVHENSYHGALKTKRGNYYKIRTAAKEKNTFLWKNDNTENLIRHDENANKSIPNWIYQINSTITTCHINSYHFIRVIIS
jgi:hypothetical protein